MCVLPHVLREREREEESERERERERGERERERDEREAAPVRARKHFLILFSFFFPYRVIGEEGAAVRERSSLLMLILPPQAA